MSNTNEIQFLGIDFTGDFLTFSITDGNTSNDGMRTGFGVDGRGSQNFPLVADTTELATVWALGDSLANISSGTGWLKDSLEAGDVRISQAGTFEIENPTALDSIYFHNPDGGALNIISDKAELTGAQVELNTNNFVLDGPRFNSGVGADEYFLVVNSVGMVDTVHNIAGGGGTGWLKDSIAVGDVDIAMNRNQLSFSSDIPFVVANDTLISLSTPRSDAAIIPHYLVFNFGNQSAGFREQDSNMQFFNTVTNEGLSYAGDYYNGLTTNFLQNRSIPDVQTVRRIVSDSVGGGGSAFWEDASGVVRTVATSSGLDFVFGSSQLDDSGTSAEDARFFFDNSKGAFYAGQWTGTQADDANRGFNSVNLSRNSTTSAYTSAAIGGENNDIDATGVVAVACDDCISDSGAQNSIVTGQDARTTLLNEHVQGGGGDLNLGHHQFRRLIAWKDHSGTGSAVMHLNGTSTDLVIPNNTAWGGQCECTALVKTAGTGTSVGDHKFYQGRFLTKNIAGSTSIQFIDTTDGLLDSPSFSGSSFSMLADDVNDAVTVLINSVPGSGTSVTHFTCVLTITETGY